MTVNGKGLGRAGLVALAALGLDQLSKAAVRSELSPGEQIDFILGIDWVRVGNDGIAFGLFDNAGAGVLVAAAASFTLLLGYFLMSSDRAGLWLPIGLLAGGALGNLIDRIAHGAVTDFIDLPHWPAFNVADIEITVGVILMTLLYLRDPDPDLGAAAADGEDDSTSETDTPVVGETGGADG
ncbi:MAG: signal peptidase II [Thermoleophilia bacterium]|nr:signal peptidase II [Thermoleophilia bacterium]